MEELLERFEAPNEGSDEQFIVEALTGEKVRDRTLEPRSFFGESEEDDIEEVVRTRIRELFGELTEEEREKFKEMVRARLKNEEDLDALLKPHPSVKRSSDTNRG
jgi:transcription termination factor NusB